ncbi:hypothetical protein ACSMX9_06705 [Streptomyces sp. LE64]|uniref:hypothetical protein n=1 Tax=Streptomyces sp. LE64 TaxID=3448653 RepID=UPI00404282D1
MTATPERPYTPTTSPTRITPHVFTAATPLRRARPSPEAAPARGTAGRSRPGGHGSRAESALGRLVFPLSLSFSLLGFALATLPAAFNGGSTRRWFGGRAEGQRAQAQAAKDAAAAAFYDLDSAQRDLRISIETITAVDDSPAARRAVSDFGALGQRIDEVSHQYIAAVDAHDLDRDDLEASSAAQARAELTRAKDALVAVKSDLDRFSAGLGPLLDKAETQLARLAPSVERARQALLAATTALDATRSSGLKADDLAARLAALAPELTKLNQGAGRHGVPETLHRAEHVARDAEAVRSEAERLPERAAEIDRRLVSLRTRAQALTTRSEQVDPVLSELRRRFAAACWQDLQQVPDRATTDLRQAELKLAEAQTARDAQRWPDAASLLSTARALLNATDEAISAAGNRLRMLNAVAENPEDEIERTRFAIRDAQRLAMAGRHTPDPRHARPLDTAVERLERAIGTLQGRHPDYWHFLTETEAVRQQVSAVVSLIRGERGTGS